MIKSTNLLYIVFCFLEEKNIRIRVFLNICIYICYMVYIKKTSGSTRESIVYFWLGTCDFTIKSRKDRFIRLKYNTKKYRPRIDSILDKVQKLKRQIEVRYKKVKTILLECPPFSIVRHNTISGSPQLYHLPKTNRKIGKLNMLLQ
jgi:hypothetical protein